MMQAFDLRQTHDCGETLAPDADTATSLVSEAGEFVAAVEAYLRDQGFIQDET